MSSALTIGVDLGGSNLRAAVVDRDGLILDSATRPSPPGGYARALDAIVELVTGMHQAAGAAGVEAVGVATAAFFDAERERIVQAANLGWRDRHLGADLRARLDIPVTVLNDADAAAWGEHAHGAAASSHSSVTITLGTGVGGGVVIGGELITGANGLAGEIGHLPVVADGHPCGCGGRGCLEQYASGPALRRLALDRIRERPADGENLVARAGGEAEAIRAPLLLEAAIAGDELASEALGELAEALGAGVASLVALLDPDLVLVGGGLGVAGGEMLLDRVRLAFLRRAGIPSSRRPEVLRLGQLGVDAGLIGAAALARSGPRAPGC